MKYGFVRVAAAVPQVKVADCRYNASQAEEMIFEADENNVQAIVFPELNITGYSCGDLFGQALLLEQAEIALMQLMNNTRQLDIISILGMPVLVGGILYNTAVVIQKGKILGVVPKTYLPNYSEFYEKRWFAPATTLDGERKIRLCGQSVPMGANLLFDASDFCFGIELCEDVWAPVPPSSTLALAGADVIFNLSADTENIGKHQYLRSLLAQQSARCLCGYVFASCGFGESSTDVVFAGNALIYENGSLLASSNRFSFTRQLVMGELDIERLRGERQHNTTFASCLRDNKSLQFITTVSTEMVQPKDIELTRAIDAHPFVPSGDTLLDERCEEIFSIQVAGLAKRLVHTGCKTVVVGISGGLDSTLALLVCVKTFDKLGLSRDGIVGITMPGFGTTDRTYNNALSLMRSLRVTTREISIRESCIQHFKDIDHDMSVHNVTYENGQARERTQILMDYANKVGGLVIGTGDLSELALGWATYNGDHMSMYGVNASVPKTLVRYLVTWATLAFGASYDKPTIKKWLTTFYRRFFAQQFKRSCLPDGPKVGSVSLSPRGDWRMPSDASSAMWLSECEALDEN